jgi:transglutaminase-like putative cysteine protease
LRHAAFVENYTSNVNSLKKELDDIDSAKTKADRKAKIEKARLHLEKTRPIKHVQKLDPENLPFRARKATKTVAPRLKKEEFERDFPKKKSQDKQKIADSRLMPDLLASKPQPKPVLLAFNEITSDIPFTLDYRPAQLELAFAETPPLVLAQATTDLPIADDLAETPEVQFAQDIRDLAAQLGNKPTKIFEWVQNNIEFVPTYGSIQGADMCLQSRQCNAFDANALLISLLRVSNLPARFVYGTIEIPIDKFMNWVGGFSDPRAAVNFIASGGIPVRPYISGGVITKVQMEHVWVETYIPYGNYRGAIMDQSLKTWIPMDGSYKAYRYTPGFDITGTVPFNQDEYLSQVQSQNAVHYYQSQIQNYLDANMPDTSIVNVKGYREITQETYHFLPSTLPYITVAQLGKFSSIPDGMTAKVTFTLSNPSTGSAVSYTASTAELAGKRLTVSYIPATARMFCLVW